MTKVNIRSGPQPPKFRPAGPSPASRTAARPASNISARIGRTWVREPAPISRGNNHRAGNRSSAKDIRDWGSRGRDQQLFTETAARGRAGGHVGWADMQ